MYRVRWDTISRSSQTCWRPRPRPNWGLDSRIKFRWTQQKLFSTFATREGKNECRFCLLSMPIPILSTIQPKCQFETLTRCQQKVFSIFQFPISNSYSQSCMNDSLNIIVFSTLLQCVSYGCWRWQSPPGAALPCVKIFREWKNECSLYLFFSNAFYALSYSIYIPTKILSNININYSQPSISFSWLLWLLCVSWRRRRRDRDRPRAVALAFASRRSYCDERMIEFPRPWVCPGF